MIDTTELRIPDGEEILPHTADVAEEIIDDLQQESCMNLGAYKLAMCLETQRWRCQGMAGHAIETATALLWLWGQRENLTEDDIVDSGSPFNPEDICRVYSSHMAQRYGLLAGEY